MDSIWEKSVRHIVDESFLAFIGRTGLSKGGGWGGYLPATADRHHHTQTRIKKKSAKTELDSNHTYKERRGQATLGNKNKKPGPSTEPILILEPQENL